MLFGQNVKTCRTSLKIPSKKNFRAVILLNNFICVFCSHYKFTNIWLIFGTLYFKFTIRKTSFFRHQLYKIGIEWPSSVPQSITTTDDETRFVNFKSYLFPERLTEELGTESKHSTTKGYVSKFNFYGNKIKSVKYQDVFLTSPFLKSLIYKIPSGC